MQMLAPRSLSALALTLLPLAACGGDEAVPEIPDDPVGTVREIERRMEAGDATIVWDTLPERYRADVDATLAVFADTMDPMVWGAVMETVADVAGLAAEKEGLLLEMASASAEENGEPFDEGEVRGTIQSVAKALSILAEGDLATLDSIRAMDVRKFLAGAPSQLMAVAMAETADPTLFGVDLQPGVPLSIDLVEEGDGQAVVELTSGEGEPARLELTEVDGRWLPSEMVGGWDVDLAEAQAQIRGMFEGENAMDKAQLVQILGSVGGVVDGLRMAETAEEFETTMQQGMFSLLGAFFAAGLGDALSGGGSDDDAGSAPFTYEIR